MQQKGKGFAGDVYRSIANKLFKGEKLRPGEVHVPQFTTSGIYNANFSGPGTHVIDRIKEGKRGITTQDKAANAHDIRYSLAKNHKDVRIADDKMVQKLWKESSIWKPLESLNNLIGAVGIKAKTVLEDVGIVDQNTFTTPGSNNLSSENEKVLRDRLDELEL